MLGDLAFVPLALTLVAAFLAGLARGFSGFGAALIFVPVASAVIGPRLAVPLLLVVDGIMALPLIPHAVGKCHWPDVLVMTAGALIGVPVGTWLLAWLPPLAIRWGISLLVLLLLAVLASGWRYHNRPVLPLTAGVGATAGVLSGIAQVGGPPVVVYWLGGPNNPMTVRANIIVYFALSSAIATASYLAGGLLTGNILRLALLTAPLYGLALWVGARLFQVASERTFRRICFALITGAAFGSLPLFDSLWR